MALNERIKKKIIAKAGNDEFIKKSLPTILTHIDEGRQAKRELEKYINKINRE